MSRPKAAPKSAARTPARRRGRPPARSQRPTPTPSTPIEDHPRLGAAINAILNGKMDQEVAETIKPPMSMTDLAIIRNEILPECLPLAANQATDGITLAQTIADVAKAKYIQRRLMTREAMAHRLMGNAVAQSDIKGFCELSTVSNECLVLLAKVEHILGEGDRPTGPAVPPMTFNFGPPPPANYEESTPKVEVVKGHIVDIEPVGSPWEGKPNTSGESSKVDDSIVNADTTKA